MGAMSPHPTLGRCVKKCNPSKNSHQVLKMQQKIPALIKKIQEKAISSARNSHPWVPKAPNSSESAADKKNGENVENGGKISGANKKNSGKSHFERPKSP